MKQTATTTRDVTCPFCGLHCDDLVVRTRGNAALVIDKGCDRARTGFAQPASGAEVRIRGRMVTMEQALQHAARILKQANQPLIAGLATDASGCRAAIALAERVGAAVDHLHGQAITANALVMQRRGWVMTTLSELRSRADLVVMLGTDGDSVNPRFVERCLEPRPGLGRTPGGTRRVVFIGDAAMGRAMKRRIPVASVVDCNRNRLPEFLDLLRAELAGRSSMLPRRGSYTRWMPAVKRLSEELRAASYAVIVWAPMQFRPEQADIVIEGACELITELNQVSRAAGLSLGGNDGATTATNVCAWQTGYPLRVNFASGAPEYNPSRNATGFLLGRLEADAILWITTFHPLPPPRGPRIPTIVLGPPSRRLAALSDVYFAVAIPGVDTAGTMFRLDGVVGLPLRSVRPNALPGAADVLQQIRDCI
jgi:formylmethanofuran dehydrogenase subunit B